MDAATRLWTTPTRRMSPSEKPTVGVGLQDPQLDEATQLLDARVGSLGCDRDLVPFHVPYCSGGTAAAAWPDLRAKATDGRSPNMTGDAGPAQGDASGSGAATRASHNVRELGSKLRQQPERLAPDLDLDLVRALGGPARDGGRQVVDGPLGGRSVEREEHPPSMTIPRRTRADRRRFERS